TEKPGTVMQYKSNGTGDPSGENPTDDVIRVIEPESRTSQKERLVDHSQSLSDKDTSSSQATSDGVFVRLGNALASLGHVFGIGKNDSKKKSSRLSASSPGNSAPPNSLPPIDTAAQGDTESEELVSVSFGQDSTASKPTSRLRKIGNALA